MRPGRRRDRVHRDRRSPPPRPPTDARRHPRRPRPSHRPGGRRPRGLAGGDGQPGPTGHGAGRRAMGGRAADDPRVTARSQWPGTTGGTSSSWRTGPFGAGACPRSAPHRVGRDTVDGRVLDTYERPGRRQRRACRRGGPAPGLSPADAAGSRPGGHGAGGGRSHLPAPGPGLGGLPARSTPSGPSTTAAWAAITTSGDLARWVGDQGGALVGTLPLYPVFLDEPVDPSPYRPVTKLGLNEIHIDPTGLPELAIAPRPAGCWPATPCAKQVDSGPVRPVGRPRPGHGHPSRCPRPHGGGAVRWDVETAEPARGLCRRPTGVGVLRPFPLGLRAPGLAVGDVVGGRGSAEPSRGPTTPSSATTSTSSGSPINSWPP